MLILGARTVAATNLEPPVIVGINTDFPPYEYVDSQGRPQGFDVEVIQGVAQATGLNLQFKADKWERIRGDLEGGRINLLAGMLKSEERQRYAQFSSPILVVFYGIFVRKDAEGIHTLDDLRGRRILVENGSQMHEHLKSLGFVDEVVAVESEPEALKRLASGAQDAALVPLLMGAMQMRDSGITNVRRVGDSIYSRDLCFAVVKGDQGLLERLNTGLAILNQTGEYSRIYKKWFSDLEREEDTFISLARKAMWILLPLAGLAVSALAWTWFLRRQVLQRTRELMRTNRNLQEKERFLQVVVDNLPVAVYGKDPNKDFAYSLWNTRSQEIFGLTPEEALGRTDRDFESPADAALFRKQDEKAIQQRCRLDLPDDHARSRRGDRILLDTVKVPLFDEEGRCWMVLAISEDVTLKRQTELDLMRSQASLAGAQKIAHLGSWEWDLARGEVHWSDELHRILEVDPSAQKPSFRTLLDYLPSADRKQFLKAMKEATRNGRSMELDQRILLPGERTKHLYTTLKAQKDPSGKVLRLYGTAQDLTERKNAEEVLRQAQKLEGLGVLAGGIAHDFNNLLTAILANLNLAQTTVPEDSKTAHYLKNMETTVLRAANLTRQMLAYSGRGTFVIQSLDLNQVSQEIAQLLRATISKKVEIRFALHPDLPYIDADIAQVQQVLMNLVTNASEAIGDQEGAITISTGIEPLEEHAIKAHFPGQDLKPGVFVVLVVSDTGCGIDPRIRDRLFEPFFTTKFSGRGLGLSALLGILKGHHAGIRIESQPGEGSSFRIYVPVGKGLTHKGVEVQESGAEPTTSTGTILLVDDEPVVLSSTSAMLRQMGFEVIEARDGLEALDRFREAADAITLVLLDLTMPRMNGHETLRELQKLKPDVKVILCSGYHEQDALKETRMGDFVGFLHKPFRLRDLRTALKKMPR